MDGVKSPRGKKLQQEQRRKRESKVMEPDQVMQFLAAARETRFGALFALAFHTGCRPGELLALKWDDLDTEARTLKIRRNIKWKSGEEWYLDDPKTDTSRRVLRLDAGMLDRLAEHRRRQLQERLKVGRYRCYHQLIRILFPLFPFFARFGGDARSGQHLGRDAR